MRSDLIRTTRAGGLAADEIEGESDGPPIVLLHGLTFDRTMWRPTLERLTTIDPGRRAIAVDLPGHGESPDADSYRLTSVLEQIRDVVVDAGVDAPVLVGHSGSAATAAMYAATHPTSGVILVEGSFLVAPWARMIQSIEPILRGPGFAQAWARIAAGAFRLDEVPADVRVFVEETSRPRAEVIVGYWEDLLDRTPEEITAWVQSSAERIRALGLPMRSVVGQEPSPDEAAWIAAHLPELETLVWPGSGHFPHLAHPEAFAGSLASTRTWAAAVGSPRA